MAVTVSGVLARIPNNVTAIATAVVSGAGTYYLGTDVGDVYKYNDVTGVVTKLGNIGGMAITSMTIYGTGLFCGTNKGSVHSMTTS